MFISPFIFYDMRISRLMKFVFFSAFIILTSGACGKESLEEYIKNRSVSLEVDGALNPLIEVAGDKKLVLLGEASHGTYEYYVWRDSISRRLIKERGFNFIAVEGDFASLYELNRYVKNLPGAPGSAREVLSGLSRWPQWMWGNEEVVAMVEWLRAYNDKLPEEKLKAGFYGMDVYDEWRSKEAVLSSLENEDIEIYRKVSNLYQCFAPYQGDSWQYARSVQQGRSSCQEAASQVVKLLESSERLAESMGEQDFFYLLQNAIVKQNAEKFYRKSATRQDASGWNSRAHHMHETVNRLLELYGEDSKGIVWAHNTHVGDARFTDMFNAGNQNIGELSRVYHGPENVFSVGFTTYKGRVLAGASWEARMQDMRIAPARRNSVEYLFNKTGKEAFYLIFSEEDRTHEDFMEPIGHRAVGVVFNPANEPRQYVNTVLPLRYDAFFFFRNTGILNSLK